MGLKRISIQSIIVPVPSSELAPPPLSHMRLCVPPLPTWILGGTHSLVVEPIQTTGQGTLILCTICASNVAAAA
jgi:hypothetical protein